MASLAGFFGILTRTIPIDNQIRRIGPYLGCDRLSRRVQSVSYEFMSETARKMKAGDVAFALRRQITSARYLKSERLPPERSIAEQYGVSRATVRDALRQLEAIGFVERRAGSGTYVSYSESTHSVSIVQSTSPLELVDARVALEPQIARLAVLHATDQNLQKAESALLAMESCDDDPDAFADGDERFHLALAECTKNSLLIWMSRRVSEVRSHAQWAQMRQITLTPVTIDAYNRDHRTIYEAVRNRDAEAAVRAMQAHLRSARASLLEAASG